MSEPARRIPEGYESLASALSERPPVIDPASGYRVRSRSTAGMALLNVVCAGVFYLSNVPQACSLVNIA
jgi:hypothetical protein